MLRDEKFLLVEVEVSAVVHCDNLDRIYERKNKEVF